LPQLCLLHLPRVLGKVAASCLCFLILGISLAPVCLRGRGMAQGMSRHLPALPQLSEGSSVSHCRWAIAERSSSGLDASPSRCSRSDGQPSHPVCPCSAPWLICQGFSMLGFPCLHCEQTPVRRERCEPPRGWVTLVLLQMPGAASPPCSRLVLRRLLTPTWYRCWVHARGGGRGCLSLLVPRGLTLFQDHCLAPDHGPKPGFWWSPPSA